MSSVRVLHCPEVVAGHAPQLARAERALGLAAWCVAFHGSRYGYPADELLARPGDRFLALERKRAGLLWRALRHFDVVHYNFGSPIFPCPAPSARPGQGRLRAGLLKAYQGLLCMADLPLLRRAGKALFVTFQGDDARQGDYCRRHFPLHFVHEVDADYYPPGSDERKRAAIERFGVFAHGIYALNPDLLHVLPRGARFLPYSNCDPREWRPGAPVASATTLRIVHAPSHRAVKGTRYLVQAVERLKAAGLAIELRLVENMTRENARRAYEEADLAVDQLLAGWYGGFAVEAMALGKPVVAYLREDDLRFLPPAMRGELPLINAEPSTIEAVLERLARGSRAALREAGARARAFVEKWHDPEAIAAQTAADYRVALAA